MKELPAIRSVIDKIAAVVPSGTTVQTKGGDDNVDFPRVIVSWNRNRTRDHGANPFSHYANGKKVNHYYFQMILDIEVKSHSESDGITMSTDIEDAFLLFEASPSDFHADSYLWEVGEFKPQNNPVMEPDWYETTSRISFRYLKPVTQATDAEKLETIQYSVTSE